MSPTALRNRSNIVFGRAWSPSLHWHDFVTFCWDKIAPLIINYLHGYLGDIGWRISSAGKGFMPFLKKCPNRWKISRIRELKEFFSAFVFLQNLSNIVLGRAWSPSLHKPVPLCHFFVETKIAPLTIKQFLTSSMRHPESRISFWKIVTYRL